MEAGHRRGGAGDSGGYAGADGMRRPGTDPVQLYETRIDAIVNRLDAVSQELSQVPIEEIAGTLHGISTELDSADIQGIIRAVRSLSDQLEAMDWEELSRQADGILLDTQESLAKAGETMEKAAQALDELDIEALNAAIADLQTVIEPLALLAGRFG